MAFLNLIGLVHLGLGIHQLLVLLHVQLVTQPGDIHHGMLCRFLGHGCSGNHLIQIIGHDRHLLLSLHSGPSDGLVGAGLVAQVLVDVSKLLLCHMAIAVDLL